MNRRKAIVGQDVPLSDFKAFMDSWSVNQAEVNHVETIEEANDFEIFDPEDDNIFPGEVTVYEMHEIAADSYTEQRAVAPEQGQTALDDLNDTDHPPPGDGQVADPQAGGVRGGELAPPRPAKAKAAKSNEIAARARSPIARSVGPSRFAHSLPMKPSPRVSRYV